MTADGSPPPRAWGRGVLALLLLLLAVPVAAQSFPALSGRVVDAADILPPAVEASIATKLEGLETQTGRQLVVATVPSLEGYEIEDYGYRLGRAWGIGQAEGDDGAILLVAPAERRVRVEVGYGLEPVLTDALSGQIVRNVILPRFRDGDLPGGVDAGVDAIAAQLALPAEEAQARAAAATERARERGRDEGPGFGAVVWFVILLFWIVAMGARGRRRGRRGMGGVGWVIAGELLGAAARSRGWSGGGGGWSGGGGFTGGGGSFGGGGASGSW